ncbi:IclR family transcriptional regulator [Parasedimentitalea maritima]|uniref:Helix-turn-helix domain-containing protein n=1 Tax=Parasedimentitalea maritima TaxID=2578117 RepID=A0A6A4RCV3_9RHOB|nr:IclR family transcriptional regulator [Zongyanglinia marina]KAE9627965.1 helix-turn-helix domain-containing protein [Zongyanglinia marina]
MSSNALLKALHALETFQHSSGSLTVKEMSGVTGETESSVQRSAYTLETLGYLEREEGGNRYVPGRSCLRPVYGYLRNNRFLETATPYLIDLSERFETRADLTVLDRADIVYLSRIPNKDELLNLSPLGRRWPAVSTASGRAILAALPEIERQNVLGASTYSRITPHTLNDPQAVLDAIIQAQVDGYAYQSEEVLMGAASVGSAVIGADGQVHGAVILGGPVSVFEDIAQRRVLGEAVKQATLAIGAYNLS